MKNPRSEIFYLCLSVFICGSLFLGCIPKNPPKKPPYTGPTESMYDVVSAINANNSKLPTLWARVGKMQASIVDERGKRDDYDLHGNLLYRSPRDVLLTGSHDLKPRAFELGSSNELYWVVARAGPDTAWWGRYRFLGDPRSKPIPIRPDLVLQVLGVSTINDDFNALPAPVMRFNNDADAYMFTWNAHLPDRWYAVKEVWYDRATKRPKLVNLFDVDGRIVLRAYLGAHKPVEVPDLPKEKWPTVATEYKLYFPDNGSKLDLWLEDVKLVQKNAKGLTFPNDSTFRFNPKTADAATVIQLDEECGE